MGGVTQNEGVAFEMGGLNPPTNYAVLETRILKNASIVKNVNFSDEFTPTALTAGETLLYTAEHLACQKRNDLNLNNRNYLESTFIEITNATKEKMIVGCIYRYPTMDPNKFNYDYFNPLLEKPANK